MNESKNLLEPESSDDLYEKAKPTNQISAVNTKRYSSFELEGVQYNIGDFVLITSHSKEEKPSVAIIKGITEDANGETIVTGRLFYRPEEAKQTGNGKWKARDNREMFYTFQSDDFAAECVMHHCVVHFVPRHEQLPSRSEQPGFVVQRVYDVTSRELMELTDNCHDNNKRREIDALIQKTVEQLGNRRGGKQKRKWNLR